MSLAELFGVKETWRQRIKRARREWLRSRRAGHHASLDGFANSSFLIPHSSINKSASRFTLEALEPRLLLNAAPVVEALQAPMTPEASASTSTPADEPFVQLNDADLEPQAAVQSHQKISNLEGGLGSVLNASDFFGTSVANIGDINGDLVTDLAVGLPGSNGVRILLLNSNGTVLSNTVIDSSVMTDLEAGDEFGRAVARTFDWNGDLLPDILVGAPGDDDGGTDRGAIYLIALDNTGVFVASQKISSTSGLLTSLNDGDQFGTAVTEPLDEGLAGNLEVFVGAPGDDDGGTDRGAVWHLSLETVSASVTTQIKISQTTPGFTGTLDQDDAFGAAIVAGLNGRLAVGAPGDDEGGTDRGAVWQLQYDSLGAITSTIKISSISGVPNLQDGDRFGSALAEEELNGSVFAGMQDLIVGAPGDDDAGIDRGAIWQVFLAADGTVEGQQRISPAMGNFLGILDDGDAFGSSVASLGNLDGTRGVDLVVGAPQDDDGTTDAGAVWVTFLDGPLIFTVNSLLDLADINPGDGVADAGGGIVTLRAAMQEANLNIGQFDRILFNIPGGGTINVSGSPLPQITDLVDIDASINFLGPIVLDGSLAGVGANGLRISATNGGSAIRGLEIRNFSANGILIDSNSSGNVIGNIFPGGQLTIHDNGGDGVAIESGIFNLVGANIFSNAGIGIDLGPNGITPNDALDADSGANDLQNFPLLSNVVVGPSTVRIEGTISSLPNTAFFVQFYASDVADPSGNGEGRFFIGSTATGVSDGNGLASFSATFSVTVPAGFRHFTATAHKVDGGIFGTSEFSPAVVAGRIFEVNSIADLADANIGDGIADAGGGIVTMRAAIQEANASLERDLIRFSIPGGGTKTISLTSSLPTMTNPLELDATTQPGYLLTPLVVLDGSLAGATANGLHITGGNSVVRGFEIKNFGGNGILIDTNGGNAIGGQVGTNGFVGQVINSIHNNSADGVAIVSGTGNSVWLNSIFANGGLGIDLGPDGVNQNDSLDADTGANNLQNAPVINQADADLTSDTVFFEFALSGVPDSVVHYEIYISDTPDPSGFGEGSRKFFASGQSFIPAGGTGAVSVNAIRDSLLPGQWLTVLATDQNGNTSEFSQAFQVQEAPYTKYSSTSGPLLTRQIFTGAGFAGATAVANIGDINNDGNVDFAIGTRDTFGGGAVWIVLAGDTNDQVVGVQKIASQTGGFNVTLGGTDQFGTSVAGIGDVDADGIEDLLVGAEQDSSGSLFAGAVYVLRLNADGTVKSHQKITSGVGGFTGSLSVNDRFGASVARLGDIDNNGTTDFAVGAQFGGPSNNATNPGAVWILRMNSSGTVSASQEIRQGVGGFTGVVDDLDRFGWALSAFTDLNNDGVEDLVVGATEDDDGSGNKGAAWILFLTSTGTVSAFQKISATAGGFTESFGAFFGAGVTVTDDLNGDGTQDLIVGDRNYDDPDFPGPDQIGAAWVLLLNSSGTVKASRNISWSSDRLPILAVPPAVQAFGSGVNYYNEGDGPRLIVGTPTSFFGGGGVYGINLETFFAGTTFTVTSTGDGGDVNIGDGIADAGGGIVTLRAAIEEANAWLGRDTIAFNIVTGTGVRTITPLTALPTIDDAVIIDGYTQPGASANTLSIGNNATILIELNGTNTTGNSGLVITAGNSTVRGLVINRFDLQGITLQAGDNNIIEGNFIGTNAGGTSGLGNVLEGVFIWAGSSNNMIGGTTPAARNLISGNGSAGVGILQSDSNAVTGNVIVGNYIGTTAVGDGVIGNGSYGINIGAPNTTVGGTTAGAGNLISWNGTGGILISNALVVGPGANNNVIQGNLIGTNANGTGAPAAFGNGGDGIQIETAGNQIGGTAAGAGNVIADNLGNGISIIGIDATNNIIQGNFIGIDATGTAPLGNGATGIFISSADNLIGGTTVGARNVISGNGNGGVRIHSDDSTVFRTVIQGNYIGTDVTGSLALGNTSDDGAFGIAIGNGTDTLIGGDQPGAGNVLSGENDGEGIHLGSASVHTVVQGNLIGTDAAGVGANPNSIGIRIDSDNNVIGGTTAGARNVISANGDGIRVGAISGTLIQGNYIGTTLDGLNVLGNGVGISLFESTNSLIGGTESGAGNVIAGNGGYGIEIGGEDAPTTGNQVQGNFIGTNQSGTAILGNGAYGVYVFDASNNQIGGTAAGAGNRIAFNGISGISIEGAGSTGNRTLGNAIYGNGSGSLGSDPVNFAAVGSTLYFIADDGVHGLELWKSNGTAAGTVLVKDINPGSVGSDPYGLTSVNGTLFFAANNGVNGTELWRSDGTEAGTVMVQDIRPGLSLGSSVGLITDVGGTLYFSAESDGASGRELWKSDGIVGGTTALVKDFGASPSGFGVKFLTNLNGTLVFTAETSATGRELWRSDGTAAGTVMVKDIRLNAPSSDPESLTVMNGVLFFSATDGFTGLASGRELWRSDGSPAGTQRVADIFPGIASADPRFLTAVNGTLFFGASSVGSNHELWKSDGTVSGTVLVKDIRPGINPSNPSSFTNVNGSLFFRADDGTTGGELWASDGTAVGTLLVEDIIPGGGTGLVNDPRLTNVNGTLFFLASDGVHGDELWRSDGRLLGAVLVKDIRLGAAGSSLSSLTNVNGTLFTDANDGINGLEIWTSNGTTAGTVLVKDIRTAVSGIDLGNNGVTANDALDADIGPNTLQNVPVLTSAFVGDAFIRGTLNSKANQSFLLEFFANPVGVNQQRFLGRNVVTTDGSGNAAFEFSFESLIALGEVITATATDSFGNTSEFSAGRAVTNNGVAQRRLTVTANGSGSGTITSLPLGIDFGNDNTQTFPDHAMIELTAMPATGSRFLGWTGYGVNSTSPTITVNLNGADRTYTATFVPDTSTETIPAVVKFAQGQSDWLGSLTFGWFPVTPVGRDLAGYHLHVGTQPGRYDTAYFVPRGQTTLTLFGLPEVAHYFAVTAFTVPAGTFPLGSLSASEASLEPQAAVNDVYAVSQGGQFQTLRTTGVLANDPGAGLTAQVLAPPTKGELVAFNLDGSFIYHHTAGDRLTDSFTYQASDGTTGTVTIVVGEESGFSVENAATPSTGLQNWTVVDETVANGPSRWSSVQSPVFVQGSPIGLAGDPSIIQQGTHLFRTGGLLQNRTDYTLNFTVQPNGTGAVGVLFRYSDPQNYYRFSMDNGNGSAPAYRRLVKVVDGQVTTLMEQSAVRPPNLPVAQWQQLSGLAYNTGSTYPLDLVAIGNQLQVRLRNPSGTGLLVDWAVTDSSLTGDGLAIYSAHNGTASYNLLGVDLPGTPPSNQAFLEIHTTGVGIVASTPGGVALPGSSVGSFAPGTTLQLSATAGPGFTFQSWTKNEGSDINPTTGIITNLTSNTVITANFSGASIPSGNLDVDGSGSAVALEDGIMITRYLFGVRGPALTAGAVNPAGTRTNPTDIASYLDSVKNSLLDVDASGSAVALEDGIMITRYLFGVRGPALTAGAVNPSGQQTAAADIADYLALYDLNPATTATASSTSSSFDLTNGALVPLTLPSEIVPEHRVPSVPKPTSPIGTGPADLLTDLTEFRNDPRFRMIDGRGMTAVVIDTGIDVDHPFFGPDRDGNGIADRIVYQWDFADGDADAGDRNGHGSHVASVIASEDPTLPGVAPRANLIALKVFQDNGTGNFGYLEQALQWVVAHADDYGGIDVVNLSLGDSQNWSGPVSLYGVSDEFAALDAEGIIMVGAAGNNFFRFNSVQGLAYPSADPNVIAVGSIWSADFGGPFTFSGGASDITTGPDRVTSFSQRSGADLDVFAPGARLTGANHLGGTQVLQGTSQAAAYLSGTTILAQQLAQRELHRTLTRQELTELYRETGRLIVDGDDEVDNVLNTGLTFPRVDMLALGEEIREMRLDRGHHHGLPDHDRIRDFSIAAAQWAGRTLSERAPSPRWVADFVGKGVADVEDELVITLPA